MAKSKRTKLIQPCAFCGKDRGKRKLFCSKECEQNINPLGWWKKKAWKVFSLWVRKSNADHRGYAQCVTCGKWDDWRYMDAGHWIKRTYQGTFLDERNVHPQCKTCNKWHKGREDVHGMYIAKRYGIEVMEELLRLKVEEQGKLYPREFYKEKIAHYENIIKQLE